MNKKEKIDTCIKLAELGAARWDQRRTYEWKVTLLIWAGLLAGAKFIREAQVVAPLGPLIAGGIAFLLLYALLWLRGIWGANAQDKAWDIFFRLEAARLLSSDSDAVGNAPPKTELPLTKFLANYSMLFQILMTSLVVAASIAVIASTPSEIGSAQKNRLQDGAANGSQPIRSETNTTSPAAGSRR